MSTDTWHRRLTQGHWQQCVPKAYGTCTIGETQQTSFHSNSGNCINCLKYQSQVIMKAYRCTVVSFKHPNHAKVKDKSQAVALISSSTFKKFLGYYMVDVPGKFFNLKYSFTSTLLPGTISSYIRLGSHNKDV